MNEGVMTFFCYFKIVVNIHGSKLIELETKRFRFSYDKISRLRYVTLYAISYHLYNLQKTWKIPMEECYLVKCRLQPATVLNVTHLQGRFSRFLNHAKYTKLREASNINENIIVLW